jgi:hypothetical protein
MSNIEEEAKQLNARLRKVTELSNQLKTEVKAIDDGLSRKMRARPSKYHQESIKTQVTCIDEILRKVESLNDIAARDVVEDRKKWTRLQHGGSSVETVRTRTVLTENPPPKEQTIHEKKGMKAKQETFENLYKQAEIKAQKLEELAKRTKQEEMEANQRAKPKTNVSRRSTGVSAVRKKEIDIANMEAKVREIMNSDLEDFEIAKSRRKKKWAREKREAAMAEVAAQSAAKAVADSIARHPTKEEEGEEEEDNNVDSRINGRDRNRSPPPSSLSHGGGDGPEVNSSPEKSKQEAEDDYYESRFEHGLTYEDLIEDKFSGGIGNENKLEPSFDYMSALDAVDKVSLDFQGSDFSFPDDNLLKKSTTSSHQNVVRSTSSNNDSSSSGGANYDYGKEALDELLEFSKDILQASETDEDL